MSEPVNVFGQTSQHLKTGNLTFLSSQVAAWQKLSKLIQPILPQPEQWQVVCYENGTLTITGENQAMISQLGYLQKQYIQPLSQIAGLENLERIQVRLRHKTQAPIKNPNCSRQLATETQDMLRDAACFVSDPKLSQAMLRLASKKK